jgi:hypothetical protein
VDRDERRRSGVTEQAVVADGGTSIDITAEPVPDPIAFDAHAFAAVTCAFEARKPG